MTKPLIVVDLDGTLLNEKGSYSTRTRDFFRKLNEEGYPLILASGRPYRAMKRIYEDLRCHAPVISYNGAYVFHPLDPSFPVFEASFDAKTINRIYDKTKGYVHSFMAESREIIFIDREDQNLARYFPYYDMDIRVGPLSSTVTEATFTCLFHCDPEDLGRLKDDCHSIAGVAWRAWHNSSYSELYIPNAHKGTALTYLLRVMGRDKKDVYAFGDSENDIPMLLEAGHPFAMANNRTPELMSSFPLTKKPVDEDGVMMTLLEELPSLRF